MFNLFSKTPAEKPSDVKAIREALIVFIKQELQKLEGGEGKNVKGLHLYIVCAPVERYLYDSAVYAEEENRFKKEVQRVADDFAIDLPKKWTMEITFCDAVPPDMIRMELMDVALQIKTQEHVVTEKPALAYIRVLNGQAEQKEYQLSAKDGRINIGRDKKAQVRDGHIRLNQIAFPSESTDEGNKYVSRQHAHIEWNAEAEAFMLFADEGGVPPGNKVKISSTTGNKPVKMTFTELGHQLREGDQIILGDTAVLEFSYHPD
jgi:hypothetical protein